MSSNTHDRQNRDSEDRRSRTNASEQGTTRRGEELLGDLALKSVGQLELAEAVEAMTRRLTLLVERHPEFKDCSAELLAKLQVLEHLHERLGNEVMRFSHAYEDDVVAGCS